MFLSTLFMATNQKPFNEINEKNQNNEKTGDDIYKTIYIGPQIANSSNINLYDDAVYGADYNETKSLAIINNDSGDVHIKGKTKNFRNIIRRNTDLKYFKNVKSKKWLHHDIDSVVVNWTDYADSPSEFAKLFSEVGYSFNVASNLYSEYYTSCQWTYINGCKAPLWPRVGSIKLTGHDQDNKVFSNGDPNHKYHEWTEINLKEEYDDDIFRLKIELMCEVKWSSYSVHAAYIDVVNPMYVFSHDTDKGKIKLGQVTDANTTWTSNGVYGSKVDAFNEFGVKVYDKGVDNKSDKNGGPGIGLAYIMSLYGTLLQPDGLHVYINILFASAGTPTVRDLTVALNGSSSYLPLCSLVGYTTTGHFIFSYAGPSGQITGVSNDSDGIDPGVQYYQIKWRGIQVMPFIHYE